MTNSSAPVLAVDDQVIVRHTIVLQLNKLGILADAAESGTEALWRVHNSRYSLILMDIQMPEMNGLEATAAIRKYELDHELEPSPIVAVTAGAFELKTCMQSGVNDLFEKPLTIEKLRQIVAKWAPGLLSHSNLTLSPTDRRPRTR